jgi:hypothetical protein
VIGEASEAGEPVMQRTPRGHLGRQNTAFRMVPKVNPVYDCHLSH